MTWRENMVARGLRSKRNNSPAFRRQDLMRRLSARRKRFERACEALIEVSGFNYESWAMKQAALYTTESNVNG